MVIADEYSTVFVDAVKIKVNKYSTVNSVFDDAVNVDVNINLDSL
jgi:hypothetical protein